jgi:hypothetical protein
LAVKNRPVRPSQDRANPFNNNKKYLTDPVFLIGNGTSRKEFDLERLRPYGTIIGCNALFREFSPDVLLAIDAKMLREIKKAGYSTEDNIVIVPGNRSVPIPHSLRWKTERFNTTGCFGMQLISRCMEPKICYMLGMDSYPGNLYDNTENYAVNTLQNFSGVSQYYLKALRGAGETKFINVNIKDAWPKECEDTGKYAYMTYEEFETVLCTT